MDIFKIQQEPPTSIVGDSLQLSIKDSCLKYGIDYNRLEQSAKINEHNYVKYIEDVNDEIVKKGKSILEASERKIDKKLRRSKQNSLLQMDREELLVNNFINLGNSLDAIYSMRYNKKFIYDTGTFGLSEFLLNGAKTAKNDSPAFMQIFDDFEDSFLNFAVRGGYANIYVHAIKTNYTLNCNKGNNLPAIAFSILTVTENNLPVVLSQFLVVKGIFPVLLVDKKTTVMPCVSTGKCSNCIPFTAQIYEFGQKLGEMEYCFVRPNKLAQRACTAGLYQPYEILDIFAYVYDMYKNRHTLERKNSKRASSYDKHSVSVVSKQSTEQHIVELRSLYKYEREHREWQGGHHQSPVEHERKAHERRIFNKDGTVKKIVQVKASKVNQGGTKAVYKVRKR